MNGSDHGVASDAKGRESRRRENAEKAEKQRAVALWKPSDRQRKKELQCKRTLGPHNRLGYRAGICCE